MRELTRYRTTLVRERSAELNRLQKTLEGGNVKLASVVSDLQGKSARQMLAALAAGSTDSAALAELAIGRLRAKLPELRRALSGRMRPHQCFMLAQQLAHIDALTLVAGRSQALSFCLTSLPPGDGMRRPAIRAGSRRVSQ